jgi:hypothetical protein
LSSSPTPPLHPDALFYPTGEDHLLTVELWAYSTAGWEVCDLHIPTHVLLLSPPPQSHQADHPSDPENPNDNRLENNDCSNSHNDNDRTVIPWEKWGTASHPAAPQLDRPRDLAPLGPLSHGMRRLAWDCGMHHQRHTHHPHHHHYDVSAGAIVPGDHHHGLHRNYAPQAALAPTPTPPLPVPPVPVASRKTIAVYDLHPGRVRDVARDRALRRCGGGGGDVDIGCCPEGRRRQQKQQLCIVSEVPLPRELQEVDPVGLKFVMCEDALVVFEVRPRPINTYYSVVHMAADGVHMSQLLEQDINRLHVLSF